MDTLQTALMAMQLICFGIFILIGIKIVYMIIKDFLKHEDDQHAAILICILIIGATLGASL